MQKKIIFKIINYCEDCPFSKVMAITNNYAKVDLFCTQLNKNIHKEINFFEIVGMDIPENCPLDNNTTKEFNLN